MLAFIKIGFLDIRVVDLIDIALVAIILFQLYRLVKGNIAFRIFTGFIIVYLLSLVAKAFDMQLMGDILGSFVNIGVLALLIVFQPEIRRFLLYVGRTSDISKINFWKLLNLKKIRTGNYQQKEVSELTEAIMGLAASKTGVLIIFPETSRLRFYANTGVYLNAHISRELIESIFFKNSPLHDGAVIIAGHIIAAAKCVLPISDNPDLPPYLGLRHRCGVGMTEQSDATAIMVSEENGDISYAKEGQLYQHITEENLRKIISKAIVSYAE